MIKTRINPIGLEFQLTGMGNQTKISLIKSPSKNITVDYNIEDISQMWYNWQMRGMYIQRAFAALTAEHREFLQTGITPEHWNEIFKEKEE